MRVLATFFTVAALLGAANGQVPKGNVFVGYSFLSADKNFNASPNLNGWEASVEGKFLPFLSVVGDVSGHYGSDVQIAPACPIPGCIPPTTGSKVNSYLVGPRVSVSIHGIRPFAHFLVGGSHTSRPSAADTSFATALGGGVDFRIVHFVGWRVQGDFCIPNSSIPARTMRGFRPE